MDGLYGWVGNIAFYLIFITVAGNLLPGKKYEKYLKLFMGMVLILVVLQPLTGSLGLEDRIAYFFETITFQSESGDLQKELIGMEQQRLQQMIEQYEAAVAEDVKAMAADLEFYPVETEITIEADREKETFGTVTHIRMKVSKDPVETDRQEISAEKIEAIDPVNIQTEGWENRQVEKEETGGDVVPDESLNKLRRKVEEYYGLQTMDVEIQLEKRKG